MSTKLTSTDDLCMLLFRLKAYFVKPDASDFRNIFLISFQKNVWVAGMCVYLLLIITLKLFLWITIHFIKPEQAGPEGSINEELYSESLIWVIGVVTQQGI